MALLFLEKIISQRLYFILFFYMVVTIIRIVLVKNDTKQERISLHFSTILEFGDPGA